LLQSLASFVGGADISLLEVYDDRGHTSWGAPDLEHLVVRQFPSLDRREQPPWLPAAIAAPPTQGAIELLPLHDSTLICLGGLHGIWRFIDIGRQFDDEVTGHVGRLTTIFANLMRLIDRFERDPLTGLLNRQSFDHRFEDLIDYQQQNPSRERTSGATWLAIADIDHFKRVNDTYGHLFGDEILLLVSQIMRQSFRFDDLLFRYGGEEFIIIVNNTDETGAQQALDRFCAAIRAYEFPRLKALTMSVGWTAVSPREFSTDVIHKADKALYYAKENGRDQVINYENVIADPGATAAGV
jgi:diguanylate cyclase (GGDEF)-like protein